MISQPRLHRWDIGSADHPFVSWKEPRGLGVLLDHCSIRITMLSHLQCQVVNRVFITMFLLLDHRYPAQG